MARAIPIRPLASCLLAAGSVLLPGALGAQEPMPAYLADRGAGVPLSQFATYVREGELLIYPFFEYYRDHDAEYSPEELGYGLDEDFRGKYRASEGLIFIGYGVSDRLALEFEAAVIDARQQKSPKDPSTMPSEVHESGLGDVEGQVRWRWTKETENRPEVFTYFETVAPAQKQKLLIGTSDWELKLGSGLTKGTSWGTLTLRAAVEYDKAEKKTELGEAAVEYVKRLSPGWRVYVGIEGSQDEIEFIPEAQYRWSDSVTLKLNSAFGVTSKATDWAPEVGVMFSFPAGG